MEFGLLVMVLLSVFNSGSPASTTTPVLPTKADLGLLAEGDRVTLVANDNATAAWVTFSLTVTSKEALASTLELAKSRVTAMQTTLHATKMKADGMIKQCVAHFEGAKAVLDRWLSSFNRIQGFIGTESEARDKVEACTLNFELDASTGLEALGEISDSFNTMLKTANDEWALDQNDKPAAQLKSSATFGYCDTAKETQAHLLSVEGNLNATLDALNELTNGRVPSRILSLLDDLECVADARQELTTVQNCLKTPKGLSCGLKVIPRDRLSIIAQAILVPFMVQEQLYRVQIPFRLPYFRPGVAMVADMSVCRLSLGHMLCPDQVQLRPDACLEALIERNVERILRWCSFEQLPLDDDPFVEHAPGTTLVAQRSPATITVVLDDEGITADPVLVYHRKPLVLSYGTKSITYPGSSTITTSEVHTFMFNMSVCEQFAGKVNPLRKLLEDLIPQDFEEILLLITAVVQICFLLPCCVALWRYCRGGNAHAADGNNRTWLQRWLPRQLASGDEPRRNRPSGLPSHARYTGASAPPAHELELLNALDRSEGDRDLIARNFYLIRNDYAQRGRKKTGVKWQTPATKAPTRSRRTRSAEDSNV